MLANATIIVGLSGPSSSGKTTLARLLRRIFIVPRSQKTQGRSSSCFLLHQDDFYAAEDTVPIVTTSSVEYGTREMKNYEGIDGVDWSRFTHVLKMIREHGVLPPDFRSKEDENEVHEIDLDECYVEAARNYVESWLSTLEVDDRIHLNICIVEGWLLFPDPTRKRQNAAAEDYLSQLPSLVDTKLFMRSTFSIVNSRRTSRSGYVMQDSFWVDPAGYVEEVVWPVYVEEHSWLFDGPDVEKSQFLPQVSSGRGGMHRIFVAPGLGDTRIEEVLQWAVDVLTTEINSLVSTRNSPRESYMDSALPLSHCKKL